MPGIWRRSDCKPHRHHEETAERMADTDELKREAIEFHFGGKVRQWRFEFHEIRALRQRWPLDNPIDTFNRAAAVDPERMIIVCKDEDALARCLWALCARDEPEVTDAQIDQWCTDFMVAGGGTSQLADAVWGAFFIGGLGHANIQEFRRKNPPPEAATAPPTSGNGGTTADLPRSA